MFMFINPEVSCTPSGGLVAKLPKEGDILPHGAEIVYVNKEMTCIEILSDMNIEFTFDESEYASYTMDKKKRFCQMLEFVGIVSSITIPDMISFYAGE